MMGIVSLGCSSSGVAKDAPLDAGAEAQREASPDDCSPDMQLQGQCPTLAGYGLFAGNGASQEPAPGVVPYDVIVPLFSDFATKHRFLRIPPGETLHYDPTAAYTLPEGGLAAKTFAFVKDERNPDAGETLVETRLLIMGPNGLTPITYVWNAAQDSATRLVEGENAPVTFIDDAGVSHTESFEVPNTNECMRCHGNPPILLGVKTRQLNHDYPYATGPTNVIDHLASLGLLDSSPATAAQRETLSATADMSATLDARARSYLDANCGHCHNANAAAAWSGLYLDFENTDTGRLGVCKPPSSAGDTGGDMFDLVPGDPAHSVLVYRMQLTNSPYRMPEASRVPDPTGIGVVSPWIGAMAPVTCP
jgi:uncharacterized repeat protein (TIGR03806 family)